MIYVILLPPFTNGDDRNASEGKSKSVIPRFKRLNRIQQLKRI